MSRFSAPWISPAAVRRTVIGGLTAAALVIGLSACANPYDTAQAGTTATGSTPASAVSPSAKASSAATAGSSAATAGTMTTSPTTAVSAASSSSGLTATGTAPKLSSDLASGSAHHNLAVDGESFALKVDYWTTTPVAQWSAMGGANLHVAAYLNPTGTAPDVMIDNFSVEWNLDALTPGLNGLALGRTVDAPAGSDAGFQITKAISYSTVSDHSGADDALFTRWNQLAPGQVINAAALAKAGVYGITIDIRYDLLVKNAGDKQWHRRTVVDQLNAPLSRS